MSYDPDEGVKSIEDDRRFHRVTVERGKERHDKRYYCDRPYCEGDRAPHLCGKVEVPPSYEQLQRENQALKKQIEKLLLRLEQKRFR